MPNGFSAQDSAMGYLYQARFALYLLLYEKKLESELSIELFDDVALEESGSPAELLQLKHYVRRLARYKMGAVTFGKRLGFGVKHFEKGKSGCPE